jgi:ATP-binding cassette subfamily B protein
MLSEEPRIPALNEKPSTKEILRAFPFIVKFIYQAYPRGFLIWAIGGILQVPFTAAMVYATKVIIDSLASQRFSMAVWWGCVLVVCIASNNILGSIDDIQTDSIRFRLEYALNQRTIQLMNSLPFSVIEQTEFRMLSDAFQRKQYVVTNVASWGFYAAYQFAGVLGFAAVFAFIPWPAILLLCVAVVLRILASRRETLWNWNLFRDETREGRRANYYRTTLTFPFSLLPVKSWGLHTIFLKKWNELAKSLMKQSIGNVKKIGMSYLAIDMLYVAAIGIGLGFILTGSVKGTVTVGAASAFLSAFPALWRALGGVLSNARMIQRESTYLVVIRDFFSIRPEADTGVVVPKKRLTISFEDVWFHYPGNETEVLRGVNLSFREGERVAIIGLNGAGKTTLLKLLMGVFHPTKGRIMVNGVDLSTIKPSAWRRVLSVLGQEVPRFDDVIIDQIRYGDAAASIDKARLDEAIQSSGLREVMPDFLMGLETHAGKQYAMPEDKAIELSGGQNQIVGIARALYRQARIYIFDEPTSSVDAQKEEHFFTTLPDVLAGKAILFVSHRFSTLRQAEHIIVVDQGRVIEEGSHDELMFKKGRYAELFTLQAKAYQ